MTIIPWKLPWRPLQYTVEIPGLQKQLEKEIGTKHPLWGKEPRVLGRRVDNDDVLVELIDGRLANVHLTWGPGPDQFPSEYPSTVIYPSIEACFADMQQDADDYGEEEIAESHSDD